MDQIYSKIAFPEEFADTTTASEDFKKNIFIRKINRQKKSLYYPEILLILLDFLIVAFLSVSQNATIGNRTHFVGF